MNFNRIKDLAEKRNVTIVKLAEKTGLTATGIHKIVKKGDCKVSDLEKISAALGVSTAYWWNDEEGYLMASEPEVKYGWKDRTEMLQEQLKMKDRLIERLEKDLEHYETDT